MVLVYAEHELASLSVDLGSTVTCLQQPDAALRPVVAHRTGCRPCDAARICQPSKRRFAAGTPHCSWATRDLHR